MKNYLYVYVLAISILLFFLAGSLLTVDFSVNGLLMKNYDFEIDPNNENVVIDKSFWYLEFPDKTNLNISDISNISIKNKQGNLIYIDMSLVSIKNGIIIISDLDKINIEGGSFYNVNVVFGKISTLKYIFDSIFSWYN